MLMKLVAAGRTKKTNVCRKRSFHMEWHDFIKTIKPFNQLQTCYKTTQYNIDKHLRLNYQYQHTMTRSSNLIWLHNICHVQIDKIPYNYWKVKDKITNSDYIQTAWQQGGVQKGTKKYTATKLHTGREILAESSSAIQQKTVPNDGPIKSHSTRKEDFLE